MAVTMTDTTHDGVTVADYAAHLRAAVVDSHTDEPARYEACVDWSDLHGVCDANDYLQEADDALGVVMPDGSGADPDIAFDDYVGFTNAAIDLVEADWPIPTGDAS